jgi:hypothetical protein
MKKLSFLFVAFAVVGFITLSSCKSSTQPAEEPAAEVVEEAAPVAAPADTAAVVEEAPAAE